MLYGVYNIKNPGSGFFTNRNNVLISGNIYEFLKKALIILK